ncbi:Alpha/Beta hydrolase protein [Podospora conica]|nr:Alpha/Beta hydrolase protein [Schizothecium conicum]
MPYLTLPDTTTRIFYKDWGPPSGPVITFSHGWPLSSDNFDAQLYFLASAGYRVIAHDRRGHGRSSQPWTGHDMDTYADDLHALFVALDLRDAVLVGHSTGGGEVARFVGRHGASRVRGAVLISAVTPLMVRSEANPEGTPVEVFDGFRAAMKKDRAQFFLDVPSGPFFGFNRPGAVASRGMVESWFAQGMQASFVGAYECVKQFSETDFSGDLRKMEFPVLLLHGDDDQVVPIEAASRKAVKLLPRGVIKVYPGAPHALPNVFADEVNRDLLEFIRSLDTSAGQGSG